MKTRITQKDMGMRLSKVPAGTVFYFNVTPLMRLNPTNAAGEFVAPAGRVPYVSLATGAVKWDYADRHVLHVDEDATLYSTRVR